MQVQKLYSELLNDIKDLGIRADFKLILKPYSKSFYGRYNPNNRKIILYVYSNEELTKMYSYEELLLTLIHEVVHCIQWDNPNYKRVRGIMHDAEFKRIYSEYSKRAKTKLLFKSIYFQDTSNLSKVL